MSLGSAAHYFGGGAVDSAGSVVRVDHYLGVAVIGMGSGSKADEAVGEYVYPLPLEGFPVRQKSDPLSVIGPLSAAAELMGVPPGSSPAEVGKTKTHPLPAAQKQKRP